MKYTFVVFLTFISVVFISCVTQEDPDKSLTKKRVNLADYFIDDPVIEFMETSRDSVKNWDWKVNLVDNGFSVRVEKDKESIRFYSDDKGYIEAIARTTQIPIDFNEDSKDKGFSIYTAQLEEFRKNGFIMYTQDDEKNSMLLYNKGRNIMALLTLKNNVENIIITQYITKYGPQRKFDLKGS